MSNIVEKISNIPNLYKVNGAESIEISKAQKVFRRAIFY